MATSNAFIYVSLLAAVLFTIFSLCAAKALPLLAEVFSLMLSVAAAYSGVELCFAVLEGTKKLGDFQDQKLTIVLGSIAVFWVALLTVINLVKGIKGRASIQKHTPATQPQTNGQPQENA